MVNSILFSHLIKFYFLESYIKQAMIRLRDDFDSDVPKTVDELCSLPGVGPKMAFLCLQSAWNMYFLFFHRLSNGPNFPSQ